MKIAIILGTRPEIIKVSPIIKELEKRKLDYFVIHTNQHFSDNMDKIFFDELRLPQPKYNLNINSCSHSEMVGKMLIEMEKILLNEKPDVVFVQGDTNSVLAGALTSSKLGIKVGHIESGLRSFDREMPEEINRVITDHISDYLFAPTMEAKENLLKEGIDNEKIFVVGNTIVDVVYKNVKLCKKNNEKYFLITLHRPSNTDIKENLNKIIRGLKIVYRKYKIKMIFPIHPRTMKKIKEYKIKIPNFIETIEPVGYLKFLELQSNARLIFTDSGGIQEEACILGVPCITLRENTERPETIEVNSNFLSGIDSNKMLFGCKKMLGCSKKWKNPFGDGKSAKRIINILQKGKI